MNKTQLRPGLNSLAFMGAEVKIRNATSKDHEEILKIARTSPYTKDFSNRLMFSSDAAYKKGWIKVATHKRKIIGFTCIRHKVREPVTVLYFIAINLKFRSKNVGELLIEEVMWEGPHTRMELNVAKDNRAVSFYIRNGFHRIGDALNETAFRMAKEWAK